MDAYSLVVKMSGDKHLHSQFFTGGCKNAVLPGSKSPSQAHLIEYKSKDIKMNCIVNT